MVSRKEAIENYPFVVKSVVLDPATRKRFQRAFTLHERLDDYMSGVLRKVFYEALCEEDAMWDEIRILLGVKDWADSYGSGDAIHIDWLTSTVQLRSTTEPPTDDSVSD